MEQPELFADLTQPILTRIAELRNEQGAFYEQPTDEIQDIFYDICQAYFGPEWVQDSYSFEHELHYPETHLEYDERLDAWVSVEDDDGHHAWGLAALETADGYIICTCRTDEAYDYAAARNIGW